VVERCLFFSVINGEKAAVNNPVFTQKRERTLEMLIKNLYLEYMPEVIISLCNTNFDRTLTLYWNVMK